mgnify:CR=1 FL=1
MRAKIGIPPTLENQPITPTFFGSDRQEGHSICNLRSYIKINIVLCSNDIGYLIGTRYIPAQKQVEVVSSKLQSFDNTSYQSIRGTFHLNEPECIIKLVEDYYKKHIVKNTNQLLFRKIGRAHV